MVAMSPKIAPSLSSRRLEPTSPDTMDPPSTHWQASSPKVAPIPLQLGTQKSPKGHSGPCRKDDIEAQVEEKKTLLGERSPQLGGKRSRIINLLWYQNILLILDTFQCYGLLWNMSQQWPWPFFWLNFTYYLMAFNIDGVPGHGGTLQLKGYIWYPVIVISFWFAIILLWAIITRRSLLSTQAKNRLALAIDLVLYFSCLPVGLLVARLLACDANGTFLYDSAMSCASPPYESIIIALCLLYLCYGFWFSYHVSHRIYRSTIYFREEDHETYLQMVEVEYMTHLSTEWMDANFWLFSSFKAHGTRFWLHSFLYKLGLLMVYCLSYHEVEGIQAFSFWALQTLWVFYCAWEQPFRCKATNNILMVLTTTLWALGVFAMLSGVGVKSALVVSSQQVIVLITIGCFGAAILLYYLLRLILFGRSNIWPTRSTFKVLTREDEVAQWFKAIQEAKQLIEESQCRPPELVPIHLIEKEIAKIHECWNCARKRRSLVENILRNTLTTLVSLHRDFRPVSILPGKRNKTLNALEKYADVINNRRRVQGLMNPKKRQLLFNILAVRLWIGDRHVALANNLEDALKIDADSHEDEYTKAWVRIKTLAQAGNKDAADILDTFEELPFLLAKTEKLISAPASELKDQMEICRTVWKRLIRHWESNFEKQFSRKPTVDDKEAKRHWYENYKTLSVQIKVL